MLLGAPVVAKLAALVPPRMYEIGPAVVGPDTFVCKMPKGLVILRRQKIVSRGIPLPGGGIAWYDVDEPWEFF